MLPVGSIVLALNECYNGITAVEEDRQPRS